MRDVYFFLSVMKESINNIIIGIMDYKSLTINVSSRFDPARIISKSAQDITKILEYGLSMFDSSAESRLSHITAIEGRISGHKLELDVCIAKLIAELRDHADADVRRSGETIDNLRWAINNLEKDKTQLELCLRAEQEKTMAQLRIELEMACATRGADRAPRDRELPDEKGVRGEDRIHELLATEFPTATIERVRHEPHAGDMIIAGAGLLGPHSGAGPLGPHSEAAIMTCDRLMCLIEVKNKGKIVASDIRSFESAVALQKDKRGITSALFLSICDTAIPHKSTFTIEYLHGIPVIYVALVHPRVLFHSIRTLRFIVNDIRADSDQDQMILAARGLLADANGAVASAMQSVRLNMQHARSIDAELRGELLRLERVRDRITVFYKTYPSLCAPKESVGDGRRMSSHITVPYSDAEMKLLSDWVIRRKVTPTIKDIEEILGIAGVVDKRSPDRKELQRCLIERAAQEGVKVAAMNKQREEFTPAELDQIRAIIIRDCAIPSKATVDKELGLAEGNKKILKDIRDQMAQWLAAARAERLSGGHRHIGDRRSASTDSRRGGKR